MRRRHQTGGLKKHRGKWMGQWWFDGKRVAKVLGPVKEMTKGEAREKVAKIVAEENAKREANRVWKFGEFVEQIYFPYYSRKWKASTREEQREQGFSSSRFGVRRSGAFKLPRDELQDLLDRKANLAYVVLGRRSSAVGHESDFRNGGGGGPGSERNPALLLFTPKEAVQAGAKGNDH
jgi:hypothetical protein